MIKATRVRHAGLMAPNGAEQAEFYEQIWGLKKVGERDGITYLRGTSSEPFILSIHPGPRRGVHHVGLAVTDRMAVEDAAAQLRQRGVRLLDEPHPLDEPGGGYGFRFVDPDGRRLELACEAAPAGDEDWTAKVKPTKISHVVLNSPDLEAIADFYTGVLGFRVSDWSENLMVFLRCNTDHHSIAFNRAPHASLNHIAYEVPEIDDVMRGIGNLKRHGRDVIWGPGRHTPVANNVFAYFQDPAGFVMEYTCGLGQVLDEASYQPQVLKRDPELMDQWGTAGAPSPQARAAMLGEPDPEVLATAEAEAR